MKILNRSLVAAAVTFGLAASAAAAVIQPTAPMVIGAGCHS